MKTTHRSARSNQKNSMTKKTRESSLRFIDTQKLSGLELLKFTFSRNSFYRDYKLLHGADNDRVKEKLGCIIDHANLVDLSDEVRVCFLAALDSGSRKTYYFNLYTIELIELYYSNILFSLKSRRLEEEHHLVYDDPFSISYEWVLYARILNPYQRYLLFEYITLGYSIEDLARRRYCTSRSIMYHLQEINLILGL